MLTYEPVAASDLDALADLRVEAMQESLARLGRFDPTRARERFIKHFDPPNSRHLRWNSERVGVIVVKHFDDRVVLENLYLYRRAHGQGIGSEVLRALCDEADAKRLPIHVIVLAESDAIGFYQRAGFVLRQRDDVDCLFVRLPR